MTTIGSSSKRAAAVLRKMCSEDMLFWVNSFVWTQDPRVEDSPALPMVTYAYQDFALMEMDDAINHHNLLNEKSRDMGLTWLCLIAFDWRYHFRKMQKFLVISRVEEYVDKQGNDKTLFSKLDFIHRCLPSWMFNSRTDEIRNHMMMHNLKTGSNIDGEATTGDVGRGDRRTAILLDEFAAVKRDDGYRALNAVMDTAKCTIFNSTPQGSANAFYDVAHDGTTRKLRIHWAMHPEKAKGLYTANREGKLVVLDNTYQFPSDYYFRLDGKLRSPWYDYECDRRSQVPMLIAQELDIDYLGAASTWFDEGVLRHILETDVVPPYTIGELDFDAEVLTLSDIPFMHNSAGRLKLWYYLDVMHKVQAGEEFVVGADISQGRGASNSCLSVVNRATGEKVAEFVTPYLNPEALAPHAIMLCRFFNNAFLIWEANGPGGPFGDRIMELGYKNVYFRTAEDSVRRTKTDKVGWWSNPNTKMLLLGQYRRGLGKHFINHSDIAVRECREYIFNSAGNSVEHSRSLSTIDPSGAKHNHGDRVIADALAWHAIRVRPTSDGPKDDEIPENCLEARRRRAAKEDKRKKNNFRWQKSKRSYVSSV